MTESNAAERAYLHTKSAILRGTLGGGQLLSEAQLGIELGISRTPVHEAFLRLSGENLIILSSRKGAVVVPMNPREARDVLEMREAIERSSAGSVVRSANPARLLTLIDLLSTLIDEQRIFAASGDVEAFEANDDSFHSAVVDAAANPIAVGFYSSLQDRRQRLRHQFFSVQPDQLAISIDDHAQLRDTLAARNLDTYHRVLSIHIARNHGAL